MPRNTPVHYETKPAVLNNSSIYGDEQAESLCGTYSAFKTILTSPDKMSVTCKKCLKLLSPKRK